MDQDRLTLQRLSTAPYDNEELVVNTIRHCHQIAQRSKETMILARFEMGRAIHALQEGATHAEKYGKGTINKISADLSIPQTTLRESVRFFAHKRWRGDQGLLKEDIDHGRISNWRDVQEAIRSISDPDVIGKKNWVDQAKRRVEAIGRDFEAFNEIADQVSEDERREFEGVAIRVLEEIGETQLRINSYLQHKKIAHRSPEYLAWIRTRACVATGIEGDDVQAHHAGSEGGMASKCSDLFTIPLIAQVHEEVHRIGQKNVEKKYRFNVEKEILRHMHIWISGTDPYVEGYELSRESTFD